MILSWVEKRNIKSIRICLPEVSILFLLSWSKKGAKNLAAHFLLHQAPMSPRTFLSNLSTFQALINLKPATIRLKSDLIFGFALNPDHNLY